MFPIYFLSLSPPSLSLYLFCAQTFSIYSVFRQHIQPERYIGVNRFAVLRVS